MEKYIDYEMCKQCGGACCKQNGCVYKPTDFSSMDFSYLKDELEKGKISISGQPTKISGSAWTYVPYLRARNINAGIIELVPIGNPCGNLTNNGCSLSEDERPTYGLLVKPTKIGGPCEMVNSSDSVEWLYYSDVLEKLVKYYTKKEIVDVLVDEISDKIVPINEKMKNNIKLSSMEKMVADWYYKIIANSPYFYPDEVKKMILF